MTPELDRVKALVFDVFGTLVDWRTSVAREMAAYGGARGLEADWTEFAMDWRSLYQPAMEEVRRGRRPFAILDDLHRENLGKVIDEHGLPQPTARETEQLVAIWHRLTPWPDSVEGLTRLKSRYIIAPLSNGNIGLMTRLAKFCGLPWDAILGAEIAGTFKPMPEVYLSAARALNLEPAQVMLVAAHNDDLAAARSHAMRSAFVARPSEYGPGQTKDLAADPACDLASTTITGIADLLGCPA